MDETGKQHFLDATVAYKRAVLNCIDYFSKFGYTREQVRLDTLCQHGQRLPHRSQYCTLCISVFQAKRVVHCAQIYLLLSCCPCEGRISGIVDVRPPQMFLAGFAVPQ